VPPDLLAHTFDSEVIMSKPNLNEMALEELWLLHEDITKVLSAKITAEKLELEKRLAQLNPPSLSTRSGNVEDGVEQTERRRYPKVIPKYRNPAQPSETWSGRGRQPRWVQLALQSGQMLEDFEIGDTGINNND
jgi:DNA-binding protein H-NS